MKPALRRLGFVAALILWSATSLLAHNSPSSAVLLDFYRDRVGAELTLPLAELELSFKQSLLASPGAAYAQHRDALKDYVATHIQPVSPDGRVWSVKVESLTLQTNQQPFDLVARVTMTPPAGATTRKFNFNYSVINHEVMSHCVFVSVRSDCEKPGVVGEPESLGMIHFTITSLAIDRTHSGQGNPIRISASVLNSTNTPRK
ncbi:MAG: hypothetical protein EPO07_16550 [Verrucomicrobia bacterium]|nr:MAG: hypothetical protein EPO07_16550 [Verrucomicrobiota bacterium]